MSRRVELLTPGQYVTLDEPSAERLECLFTYAVNGAVEEVHRFSLTFERAQNGVFYMPGRFWKAEFEKRLNGLVKRCDIRMEIGTEGAESQWRRENPRPEAQGRARRG